MTCIFAHPIWLTRVIAVLIPLVLFRIEYRIEHNIEKKENFFITLTPSEKRRDPLDKNKVIQTTNLVDFNPRIENYLKVAEVMLTLSSASLVFIPTLHLSKSGAQPWFAIIMVLLSFAVAYGVAFMVAMTYFYEMFLYDPLDFGALESSAMFTAGFSGLACFALAYFTLKLPVLGKLTSLKKR